MTIFIAKVDLYEVRESDQILLTGKLAALHKNLLLQRETLLGLSLSWFGLCFRRYLTVNINNKI